MIDTTTGQPTPTRRGRGTNHRLNWLNFSAADVSDGIGPFLSTYLISTGGWEEGKIGLVLLTMNLATVVAQTPSGWLIDHTRFKRYLTALAAVTIAGCVLIPAFAAQAAPVLIAAAFIGFAAAIIPPAIAAITLGIVGPQGLTRQTGSNQAFNHAGNVFAAVAIGAVGAYVVSWGFAPIVAVMAVGAAVIVLLIPEKSIDHVVARGGLSEDQAGAGSGKQAWGAVFTNGPLLVFMLCIGLFHLSNAAMLPLAGQKLAKLSPEHKQMATLYLSACVIIAQFVMIGVAVLVGLRSDRWGRKFFLLIGFAVLPLRGLWFSQVDTPWLVMTGQILDGIGAGVYGVIIFLVVADITRGTGVFNFATGVVITVQGLGASFGSWLGEWWAGAYGYASSYALLTGLGVLALLILAVFMPETHPDKRRPRWFQPKLRGASP